MNKSDSTTSAKSNGSANSQKSAANSQKPMAPKPEAKKRELSIDDIASINETANGIIGKRSKLREAQMKLHRFNLSSDDFTVRLSLTDDNGNSFHSSSSQVLQKVIKMINDDINTALIESEMQLKGLFE
jgi:hypothetical protein